MSEQTVPSPAATALDKHLAERGPLPLEEVFAILRGLVTVVRALHASGRIHRGITPQSVHVDDFGQVVLAPPAPVRTLGGMDREMTPPELLGVPPLDLPDDLAACRQVLEQAGIALDPRRIDVYQLGVLLCRMLTLQPLAAYLQSPACKARVPATVRPLLERALGYRPELRLADCEALAAALDMVSNREPVTVLPLTPSPAAAGPDATHERLGVQASSVETPVDGSGYPDARGGVRDTPPGAALPFERLGPYKILERLGRGGMGEVYLGYETALQRRVAVKVLPPELAQSNELRARFRAEATAIAQLSHPNIVPIYAVGEEDGYSFFVMQYIDGESLERRLARHKRLGVDEALDLLEQCLAGLQAVHLAGLVHRDLKPGNILLERQSGRALLADFGLVKNPTEAGNLTTAGTVLGTPDYLAPEQACAQVVDRRADLYALGVVAYQMLSGRLPFEAETPSRMIAQHAQVTARPLAQAAPAIARPLAALVDRLLARDPERRYASCAEVLADLRALQGRGPSRLVPATARAARPVVRRPLAAIAGLVVLASGASLLWHFWPRQPAPGTRSAAEAAAPLAASLTDPPRTRIDIPREPPALPPVIQPGGSVADPRRPAPAPATKVGQLPLIVKKELRRFETPAPEITAMAFSPDGRQLLTAGHRDRLLHLWDVESGRQLGHIDSKGQFVYALAFAPDGHSVALGNMAGELCLYDLDSLQERRTIRAHPVAIQSIAFSPDGKQLLSTTLDLRWEENAVRLWDVETGKELNRLNCHRRMMDGAVFCSGGRKALVATGGGPEGGNYTARLWDLETGDLVPRYEAAAGGRLTVTPDGRRALCAGDRCFFVWDPETGRILRRIPISPLAGYKPPAVSPDGLYLAAGGGGWDGKAGIECFVHLYDIQSAQEVCRFEGHQGPVTTVAYSPDGRFLASTGDGGTVRLWELPVLPRTVPYGKGEICRFQGHTAAVTSVAFSPDSRRVLSGGLDNAVRLWDIARGQEAHCFLGHADVVRGVALTPGGRYVLSGSDDRTARLWSMATGRELRCFPHPSAVTAVAWSPEGRRLATAAGDDILRLWDLDTGEQVQGFYGHQNLIRGLAFSSDGRWLVSAGDEAVRLWDVATGQERRPADSEALGRVAFSPDGPRFHNRQLKEWLTPDQLLEAKDERPTGRLPPPGEPFRLRALSPDLRTLLARDRNDLKLTERGVVGSRSLSGHTAEVTAVAISPDGQLAVSGSADQTVRVWGLGP